MLAIRQHRRVAAFFYALAVLALAFKVYVPTGFMVDRGGAVVVCTGIGAMPMRHHRTDSPTAPSKDRSDHACPYAGNAAPAEPWATPMIAASEQPLVRVAVKAEDPYAAPGRGLAAPPPSRGPPARLA